MSVQTIEGLRESVHGVVIGPSDQTYDEARKVFNAMIDRRPAFVVRCSGTADVIAGRRPGRRRPEPGRSDR